MDAYVHLENLLDEEITIQYLHDAVDTLLSSKTSQTVTKTVVQEKSYSGKKFSNNNKCYMKRIFSFLISVFLIFVPIVSVSIISFPIHSDQTQITISLNPEQVHINDAITVTVNVPVSFNVSSAVIDMGGLDSIALLLSDTTSDVQIWQTPWVVPTVNAGEYIATITLINETNESIVFETKWILLPPDLGENDYNSNETTNEPSNQLNQSGNQTSDETDYSEAYENTSDENQIKAWEITETSLDSLHKQVIVSSDIHYTNITAFTTIDNQPNSTIHLYHIVNDSKQEVEFIGFDLDNDNLVDRIEWTVPHLSEQTYEIIIEITKAEHLDTNRTFLSDISNDVKATDEIWSEPISNGEYVRVTFEKALENTNDITIVARSSGSSRIEVFAKDSQSPITTFENITQNHQYKVFLTNLNGSSTTFDLRTKGDSIEYDYIVDPIGWITPTNYGDPSSQWTQETRAYDENTATYASHTAAVGWRGFLVLNLSSPIYCDRVRVFADFDTGYVDRISIDVYNSTTWIEKYNGTIGNCVWTELEFSGETNVTKARFRYHFISGSVIFWFYEFDFWQGKLHTLPNGTTFNATSIDVSTAILRGNVSDDGGEPCQYRFQYGSNSSYGNNTTWSGSEVQNSEFSVMIHNLVLGNTYHYRVQIRNDIGTVNGSDKNFTTAVPSLGWVSPTSDYDPNTQWTDEIYAYDDDTDTYTQSYHDINDPDGQWSFYIYLNHSVLICDKIRFFARGPTGDPSQIDQVDLDVYRGGAWIDVYLGTFTDKQWMVKSFMQGSVSQARIRFRINANNGGLYYQLYELDFNNSRPVPMITYEGPTNRSWGTALRPQLNITVNNPDGASMTITWSSNSSGSWQTFGTNSTVGNGTYHQTNTNFNTNNTKYWWKVSVSDGIDSNTSLFYFSTPDLIKPTSTIVAITPYWKKSAATLTATATDTGWSGLKNVTLYSRFSIDNSSWGGWINAGVDILSPWSWSYTFPNNTGYYQFYSIAIDNATNIEVTPGSPDARCGYETLAPSSSVFSITPYWKISAPQIFSGTASDTGPSGLKNVTLRYRYRGANASSWGGWVNSGVVDTDPWISVTWSFTFSNGSGHYEFYSLANDNATNTETAPGSADASCAYDNQAPSSSLADGSISDSTISTFEWNGAEGRHPAVIRLGSSEYYLIAAEGDLGGAGATYDGWLFTIRVWSNNGTIKKSLIDSWEYDVSDGFYPSICLVNGSSNIYAITYEDAGSVARKIITTCVWSNNGSMQKTILDTLSLYRSTITSYSSLLHVNGNIYAIAYVNNSDGDGRLATCSITSAGDIGNTINDTLEFNSSDALNPQLCLVDENTLALVYDGGTAGGNDGYLVTYNISSTGNIQNTWTDQWEFDSTRGTTPSILKVWDDSESSGANWFAIGYEDTNNDLYVKTCSITDAGVITKSWVDTQAIDITNGDFCSFALVGLNSSATNKKILVGFSGEGSDGYVSSIDITRNGMINSEIDTLEFDATDCISKPWLIMTNTTFGWLIIYEGTGNDGWSCSFTLTTNEVPYWKTVSPYTIIGTGSDTGPSGMKNVTLWYRYRVTNTSSWGVWVRWNNANNPDTNPWVGISWDFTCPNGSGRYEFYSIACDNVTNTESIPSNPDLSCGFDNEKPISSVNMIDTYWTSSSSLTVTATATDGGSGVRNVTLYSRFSSDNLSWNGWTNAGVDITQPWSWFVTLSNGTGYYQFYSIARDNLTNVETVAGIADTGCGYETTAPSSSVNIITPYWKNQGATLSAVATDVVSGVKNVTLLYRFSSDNSSWNGWVNAGVDPVQPWTWDFVFLNGTGYYQFLSIAKDHAANTESTPGAADASTGYEDQAPSSVINTISEYWQDSSPLTLTAVVSDTGPSGLQNVTLYYRYRATNMSSWGSNISFGVDNTPWGLCSWVFSFPEGAGHYRLYSIATDNATNIETTPGGTGDTTCGYNTGAPVSEIDEISPYWTSTTPFVIQATAEDFGPSGLKNVTLYYYHSTDNSSWTGPWLYDVDSNPWITCSWNFPFPNQTGYYRFYSCAADNSSHIEDAPLLNDSECGYDIQSPTCLITYNTTQNSFKGFDSIRIIASFSETYSGIDESSVQLAISTLGNGSLNNTSMNMIDNTHWFYDWVVPSGIDEDGVFTARVYASDAVSNDLDPSPTIDSSKHIDNTPPVISNLAIDSLTSSSVQISWLTNENTTGHIEFGPTPSFGFWLHSIPFTMSHHYTLSGLFAATTYYYRVISYDLAGNHDSSSDATFTTNQQTSKRAQIGTHNENIPPSNPTIDGPTTGHVSQLHSFNTCSVDSNNDSLTYTFDWGDGVIDSSGLMQSGMNCTRNHSWMKAGKYVLQVTASDPTTSVSSKHIIWIDAVAVGDVGYLTDDDRDGIFDLFHNKQTGIKTATEVRQGVYLIDVNGDLLWDYEYNVTTGVMLSILHQTSSTQETQFPLMLIFSVIIMVFLLLLIVVCRRRFHKKQ